jgi:hypothetical protein
MKEEFPPEFSSGHGHRLSPDRDIGMPLDESRCLRREQPSIWETEFCHQRLACVWRSLNGCK